MTNEIIKGTNGALDASFIFQLLDNENNFKKVLTNVEVNRCSITFDSAAKIKRRASITMIGEVDDIDFFNDRVRISVLYRGGETLQPSDSLQPSETLYPSNGDAEFILGTFLLSIPRKLKDSQVDTYSITCFSPLEILRAEKVTERYYIPPFSLYTEHIQKLLQSSGMKYKIAHSPLTVGSEGFEFDWFVEKLTIINSLCNAIGYDELHTDAEGVAIAYPHVDIEVREIDQVYDTGENSIILNKGFMESVDSFNTPNKWVGVYSGIENSWVETYENTNLNSPFSIQNRGRIITADLITFENVASQEVLKSLVKREALKQTKVYDVLEFKSLINPAHGYLTKLLIDGNEYVEESWQMNFASFTMAHKCKRLVV